MRDELKKINDAIMDWESVRIQNKITALMLMKESAGWKILEEDINNKIAQLDKALKEVYPTTDNLIEYQKLWNDYWGYKTLLEYPNREIELLKPTPHIVPKI